METNPKYILNDMEFDVPVEYNKTSDVNVENEHKKALATFTIVLTHSNG